MKFTKALFAAGALSLASVSGAALAQAAAVEVTTGATVYGSDGAVVGTVAQVDGDVVAVSVDGQNAGLPAGAFGQNAEGQLTIAVTKNELVGMLAEAEAEAQAALDAALVAGTPVVDVDGTALGSVAAVNGEDVTVETEWGAFALKKDNFVAGEGSVTAQVQAAQVRSALSAS